MSETTTGMLMEGGMGLSAIANGVLAGTVDYDNHCKQVDQLKDHVKKVNGWVKDILTDEANLCTKIDSYISDLETITKNLKIVIKEHKDTFKRKLHRDEIFATMICSLVSLMLLFKLLIRHNLL
tara:strand:+ start:132 stop:503 length:372 start_codon:yes stop_codon:yes gene_type:complete